jgi:hypothetical protein
MQSGGGGGCQCRYYLDMYHSFHEMVGSLLWQPLQDFPNMIQKYHILRISLEHFVTMTQESSPNLDRSLRLLLWPVYHCVPVQ